MEKQGELSGMPDKPAEVKAAEKYLYAIDDRKRVLDDVKAKAEQETQIANENVETATADLASAMATAEVESVVAKDPDGHDQRVWHRDTFVVKKEK